MAGDQVNKPSADEPVHGDNHSRMQHFIFRRELAEVYLLFDHLSGRADKSLLFAMGNGDPVKGEKEIANVCQIGWPPSGTNIEQASQAATLLLAKDRLNATAKPATGTSIAFTILVAGDEEEETARPAWPRRLLAMLRLSSETKASQAARNHDAIAPRSGFGGEPPSRTSLATLAYPGLVGRASRFNSHIKIILGLLFFWLIVTCLLSWNVAAGKAILARLNDIETQRSVNAKKIDDAEIAEVKQQALSNAPQQAANARLAPAGPKYVQRYCERPLLLPMKSPEASSDVKLLQFDDVTQRQVCDEKEDIERRQRATNRDLTIWLASWGWFDSFSDLFCGKSCVERNQKQEAADQTRRQSASATTSVARPESRNQWASVLVEVLATAVLPVCYGLLGAGAAIVRRLWGNMKDSLLLPLDVTLALGQLALGAVIGACIGLFVNPSASDPQNAVGLTTTVTLTPSALSFIAGFGVESVFVTLESLIKRIFNIPEEKAPASPQPPK
jgi:hypothetical protein